jgi:hypothetical protein
VGESFEYYNNIYYNLCLFVVLLVYIQSVRTDLTSANNLTGKKTLGMFLLVFIVFFMGLRPISFFFGDMGMYNLEFQRYKEGQPLQIDKDIFFEMFIQASSKIMSASMFFLLCAVLYILPLYIAVRKWFKEYWFYGFLMLVISFSFWAYGTNGIRNGIGTSFFILGISRTKKTYTVLWLMLAVSVHKSLLLPIACYIAAIFCNRPILFLYFWLASIPVSLASGGFWESLFLSIGFGEEDRLAGYLGEDALDLFNEIKVGFRWDFILYSLSGVATGWYFIVKKKFNDTFYNHLFSTYLIANGFWILIIRSNFSNRFAYLSWFLLGIVIIYPLLKNQIFTRQHKVVGQIIVMYFLFTYILNVILA